MKPSNISTVFQHLFLAVNSLKRLMNKEDQRIVTFQFIKVYQNRLKG
jgi:hypothetical protein